MSSVESIPCWFTGRACSRDGRVHGTGVRRMPIPFIPPAIRDKPVLLLRLGLPVPFKCREICDLIMQQRPSLHYEPNASSD